MTISMKAPYLWHGGDYNPEQWPRETWDDDFRLMKKAGVNVITVGVFSWVSLQPAEDIYTFEWLDEIFERARTAGINVVLATPSAAQPAWMSEKYPEMLRSDERGVRNFHGGRTNYCPNSPDYRRLSGEMARRLAERYGKHPALLLWHVSNEYAGRCLCDVCAERFREWLKTKYDTLDELNARWWTPFWSHAFTAWSQILPPRANGEIHMHGLNIDYFRFMTESQLACFTNERDILRAITPDVPITTNLMGAYKPLDYRKFAAEMDVVSWDCYPSADPDSGDIAFLHDTFRGLKDGKPFLLMEQTPSSQNWQWFNTLKRPGVLRLWSWLAVAHGADSVMYFQWRRGRGGVEKLHGAVVEHSGREDTRVFREVSELGAELASLGDAIIGATTDAKVAVILDWDNWHALEDAVGPVRDKRYHDTVSKHSRAFYRHNVSVDVAFPDSDLSRYSVVVAPMLYMVKQGFAEKVEAFVAGGGTFIATHMTGRVDETDLAFENGYPGPLAKVLGVWVEETDALLPDQQNTIEMRDGSGVYTCGHLADITHAEGATVIATYGSDFYAGTPAVTVNRHGSGKAYFIASDPEEAFLRDLYGGILKSHGIAPLLDAPEGVEVTARQKDSRNIVFVLNHNADGATVALGERRFTNLLNGQTVSNSLALRGYDVAILV
jgi:beta-galactosidase